MDCNVLGCLVDHDINIIDENNIWQVYESYPEETKINVLRRWLKIYQDGTTEFDISVVKKCKKLIESYVTKL